MTAARHANVLPEAIYADLRSSIIAQEIAPGATVTESTVAARFGVARQTAKAAIGRLVVEGLLRRETHKAARVPALTAAEIADVYDSRAVVESAAVARLEGIPAAALAAHRALIEAGADFAHQDIAFHRALVAGQPSSRLARMHALIMGEVELCIGQVQAAHLLSADDVVAQHQGILDAVLAGDPGRAARLTAEHIAVSRDRLLAHVDS
ncbi:GntR family transcriptional regulator [Amycolatopsis endophytica]|uniref:DNA-binding GntR family transcriptional regulator n=1 Tax=Amycolatopsis endophytica TaxID=860233 RepID=A0A853BAK1_9PSEU|nr:GntR family transcriptional regulator [Amycolatopsis endophytica]NYI92403.1 DNA-binding GntR family transcriptional regulator [Amycolatopsis endophytica]